MIKEKLLAEVETYKNKHINAVKNDKWRNKYHIMAPIGWINDPNGLCEFKGKYHIFYQYSPLNSEGGLKFWGHYSSKDLLNWKEEDIAIYPDKDFDRDGVYSGSALAKDNDLYIFYTGNVKEDGNHDYILSGREQNVVMVKTSDGKEFSEKVVLLTNKDFPIDMTLHVRDPKVWQDESKYFMALGARDNKDKGTLLIYSSNDLYNWSLYKKIKSQDNDLGYMWECPDLFKLDNTNIFMLSPQGIKKDGYKYNNIYQSGYFLGDIEKSSTLYLTNFNELDRGFDFYAPQSFMDSKGRRIIIGWMGVPDAVEHRNPTIKNYWQHCLTIPRELVLENNKLYQKPIKELEGLRKSKFEMKEIKLEDNISLDIFRSNTYELLITLNKVENIEINLREDCKLSYDNHIFKLSLGKSGCGRKVRAVELQNIEEIRIFSDESTIEVFLNSGEEAFSTRIYNEILDKSIKFKGVGKINLIKWEF
ncbi:glycoside hydrolase family 32 protein [Clostridium chauvoei]|uniref:Sucrose-6-phosphate hydrolase n=2 Tax=Clostridium chauvoei TaxID=46867 RepID=S6EM01_9CLOT|nr:glycoside hydrolase family 32 protein [Clostridium chauvoei]ATD55531.1 sucrose-6-phosphate hydrolase [Clostridium chauvoei]ATD56793.1 sucrose-6-phosphate hydrolase [Clostridium chauvoei]MBX7281219.1 glycoside hydrolase family 32 protein [Clostridium chauvoei]MBX7283701.1 glycoside hydrolase family 32 protein [Clostridium chauvoei]MBX7286309.1 glycoside hydrolase family 32 protein [Clostridium chauvoei]